MLFARNDFSATAFLFRFGGQWRKSQMTAIDKAYYAQRAREEREREKAATTPSSAKAHGELAQEYEKLLHDLKDEPAR
jgi:hypothetical protein